MSTNFVLPSQDVISKLKNGASCYYYKIPETNLGIKFYESKHERSYARQMQEVCSLAGVAPKTGKNIDCNGYYGYITEHIPTLKSIYGRWNNVPRKIQRQLDDLVEYVYICSEHEVDCNWLNFGLINNKLVCIDFGFHDRTYYGQHQLELA